MVSSQFYLKKIASNSSCQCAIKQIRETATRPPFRL